MPGKVVIDTSSLIDMARYIMPFDIEGVIHMELKKQYSAGNVVLLKEIVSEINRTADGIVAKKLPFLNEIKAIDFVLNNDFRKTLSNKIKQEWSVPRKVRKLPDLKWTEHFSRFVGSADYSILAFAISNEAMVVTNETIKANDRKPIRKIPAICKIENIEVIDIAEYLKLLGLKAKFEFKKT